jgi:hypothetical protein
MIEIFLLICHALRSTPWMLQCGEIERAEKQRSPGGPRPSQTAWFLLYP